MENRQPTYPGRVVLTPVPGAANTYDMTRADEPTVAGTPLNKETLLQDATCAILDIPDTSVPNDAFVKLALGIGKYGYVIHVQYPDGSPAEGFTLTGLNAPDGTAAVTNANGDAVGVSTEQSVTVGIDSPYIDIQDVSGIVVESTGILTSQTIELELEDSPYSLIETSQNISFSPLAKTVDFCAVGAGGGGNDTRAGKYPAAGGGGEVVNLLGVDLDSVGREFSLSIGAGGTSTRSSSSDVGRTNAGSTTVSSGQSAILTARGGQNAWSSTENSNSDSGDGWGRGADIFAETQAVPNSVNLFNDPVLGLAGGGGGGIDRNNNVDYPGAAPYGGDYNSKPTGPGGGGPSYYGGSVITGHNGGVYCRAHYE